MEIVARSKTETGVDNRKSPSKLNGPINVFWKAMMAMIQKHEAMIAPRRHRGGCPGKLFLIAYGILSSESVHVL